VHVPKEFYICNVNLVIDAIVLLRNLCPFALSVRYQLQGSAGVAADSLQLEAKLKVHVSGRRTKKLTLHKI
jgi:hypothetical protein